MAHDEFISNLIAPFGPQLPTDELVEEVNRIYHSFEAGSYDGQHPEIRDFLPPMWKSMIQLLDDAPANKQWDVLDFGCGTGFASEQILDNIPSHKIRSITCYDPSPEMIEQCRKRLSGRLTQLRLTDKFEEIAATAQKNGKYSILLTNSVLHHLPDPYKTLEQLSVSLERDAVWFCGHEPSARFYRNSACNQLLNEYQKWNRWSRYFRLSRILNYLNRRNSPFSLTAKAAVEANLFRVKPPARVIGLLVDFHVPNSVAEAESGRGFDVVHIAGKLEPNWSLQWSKSYNFLGPFWAGSAPRKWQERTEQLKAQFPDDGANFCSVWKRAA